MQNQVSKEKNRHPGKSQYQEKSWHLVAQGAHQPATLSSLSRSDSLLIPSQFERLSTRHVEKTGQIAYTGIHWLIFAGCLCQKIAFLTTQFTFTVVIIITVKLCKVGIGQQCTAHVEAV